MLCNDPASALDNRSQGNEGISSEMKALNLQSSGQKTNEETMMARKNERTRLGDSSVERAEREEKGGKGKEEEERILAIVVYIEEMDINLVKKE